LQAVRGGGGVAPRVCRWYNILQPRVGVRREKPRPSNQINPEIGQGQGTKPEIGGVLASRGAREA